MTKGWPVWLAGCLAVSLASAGSLGAGRSSPQSTGAPEPVATHRATINRYCVACHNERVKTAGLRSMRPVSSASANTPKPGKKSSGSFAARMMPPPGRPRPDEAAYDAVVSYLETSLDRAGRSRIPILAAPRRSAGSIEPNTRTRFATCWRSISMSPRFSRKTM